MEIIVIGTGMYATGRGTDGYGTIAPAIHEWVRDGGLLDKVTYVGTSAEHAVDGQLKLETLAAKTGLKINTVILPEVGKDRDAYKSVVGTASTDCCVIVVVPDHLHYEICEYCINRNLPVLVVKPMVPALEEGRKLVDLCDECDTYGAVEFHKRWDHANQLIRDKVQSGDIGELLYSWVEYSQRKSIPSETFQTWAADTSILQYLGIHYIDLMHFITGAMPISVMATGQKNWLIKRGINTWDAIQCVIRWRMKKGTEFTQTLLTNWIDAETSPAMSDQKIKLVGTEGRIESDQRNRGLDIISDGCPTQQVNPYFCLPYGVGEGNISWKGYGIESVKVFLNDVESLFSGNTTRAELEKKRPSFTQGLISTAIVEAAHESLADRNRWVNIDLVVD